MFDGEPNFANNLQDHAFNTAVQILTIFVISNEVLITLPRPLLDTLLM